jgi:hypothetical protein
MIGYEWTAIKFFQYLFAVFMTILSMVYYGMLAIGISPSLEYSFLLSGSIYCVWNLFSGFVIPLTVNLHLTLVVVILLSSYGNEGCECDLLNKLTNCRELPHGGDGFFGYPPFHGVSMDWLLHTMETSTLSWTQARQLLGLLRITLGSDMTSCGWYVSH